MRTVRKIISLTGITLLLSGVLLAALGCAQVTAWSLPWACGLLTAATVLSVVLRLVIARQRMTSRALDAPHTFTEPDKRAVKAHLYLHHLTHHQAETEQPCTSAPGASRSGLAGLTATAGATQDQAARTPGSWPW